MRVLRRTLKVAQIISLLIAGVTCLYAQPGPAPGSRPEPPRTNNSPAASQQEAADAIQRAYDALGRSTLIAQSAPRDIGELLIRGRDTYQEALDRYQSSDFAGARETAMASADLARAVEQAATANLIKTGEEQAIATPPGPADRSNQAQRTSEDLARVLDHASRLNGELSAPASASVVPQVKGLMQQSRQFEQRAQILLAANKPEQAGAMARAADALLAAADHFMRRAWIASGVSLPSPPAPPPPLGPKGLPDPPPLP